MSNHHEEMEAHYATGRDRQDLEHADELIAGLKAENARLLADYAALKADMRDVRDALALTFSRDDPAQIFMSAADKRERAPVLWAYERANSALL